MTQLTLGSLFDGIAGFPLAGVYAGMKPVWASEIEPFCIRVTRKRLPFMKHYGDIHTLRGGELESVDVITFGSPCQNLSVAGKRDGLHGDQSSLFFEAVRIIKEMRYSSHGQYPKWAVWENVPGALSSNQGQDFRQVLTELIRIKEPEADVPMPEDGVWLAAGEVLGDDYSLAWRVLDASKGWGVAQRRKRIFVVLDLAGQRAGQVLFESEGVSGYSPPCAAPGQGTAGSAQKSAGEAGLPVLNDMGGSRLDVSENIASTLRAQDHGHPPIVLDRPLSSGGFCTEHCKDTLTGGARAWQTNILLRMRSRSGFRRLRNTGRRRANRESPKPGTRLSNGFLLLVRIQPNTGRMEILSRFHASFLFWPVSPGPKNKRLEVRKIERNHAERLYRR